MNVVGDRENLETYLNSVSKNTSEPDIFPHGIKCLLTSVIGHNHSFAWSQHAYALYKIVRYILDMKFHFQLWSLILSHFLIKAWACFVHAYIHTVFVWVHYRALPSD
jgi:hypothetical protein